MNGIDAVVVIGLVLLVALAVATGLQFAQDRAEARVNEVRREYQDWRRDGQDGAAHRFCSECGAELVPPTT
jgi:type II secretory pathway pseudopilin PulG